MSDPWFSSSGVPGNVFPDDCWFQQVCNTWGKLSSASKIIAAIKYALFYKRYPLLLFENKGHQEGEIHWSWRLCEIGLNICGHQKQWIRSINQPRYFKRFAHIYSAKVSWLYRLNRHLTCHFFTFHIKLHRPNATPSNKLVSFAFQWGLLNRALQPSWSSRSPPQRFFEL